MPYWVNVHQKLDISLGDFNCQTRNSGTDVGVVRSSVEECILQFKHSVMLSNEFSSEYQLHL